MANPFKIFCESILEKNHENDASIKQAEKLGEIVSNNAEISIGIMSKIHTDAAKARESAARIKRN